MLLSRLSTGADAPTEASEAHKALYEMLSNGTAELTEAKKYRLRTSA